MGLDSFKKVSMKTILWDKMNKTTVTLNHLLECGMMCARDKDQCNVFDWDNGSKKCTLALVSMGTIFLCLSVLNPVSLKWCIIHAMGTYFSQYWTFISKGLEN